ncbi:signal recognition particle-docking protein FtsY [Haloprofundus marisrubri]|uniref:Signal recognition particle receptor FtsY n=1 Tax=Haloprofundus marisrubri TaxID=1514971 RepID=A0A0W1R450_9EURY|nr:signal recognition particle-docking protein FtsY [Haloprofundus marisrubri]KTG07871.1 signal recognition particle-docking protein FtsY [Haloprofundus marisrubri]
MFDGLKKKLNSFRKDVEETAEEKAEAEGVEAETEAAEGDAAAAEGDAAAAEADSAAAEADSAAAEADSAATADASADAVADTASDSGQPATENGAAETSEPDRASTQQASADSVADATETAEVDESTPSAQAATTGAETPEADAAEAVADSSSESTPEPVPDESVVEDQQEEENSGPGRLKRAAAFATGRIIIEEEDLEQPLWQLEMALLQSDVEMGVAEQMLDTIREKMLGTTRKQVQTTAQLVEEALHDALLDVISVGQFDFDQRIAEADKPVTIIFTGVNGVGKTTSIAKLSEYFEKQGYSTVLANGDTYRAGANEQIRKHAENLDRKLIAHEQGGDPAAVIYDAVEYAEAHDIDIVLGDTAGRLHTSNDLMAQLEKIDRVVGPDMTLFVDEAVAGQDAVQRASKFNETAEIDGAILTKADADSSGGAAISIAYVTGKPILFLGTGQEYDDVERFIPEELVASLLEDEE